MLSENRVVPYADTPLTDEVRDAVGLAWEVDSTLGGDRLVGGEESAAFRIGQDIVVRIGPTWRTNEELEWCHQVALAAARAIPEAVAPLPTTSGQTVIRVAGHPVSVWPFIDGEWVNDDDGGQFHQAAALLARLHRVLSDVSFHARPSGAGTITSRPITQRDPDLARWVRHFDHTHPAQAVHGDFYAGNMLARAGQIVGLLDWDEAILSPPTRELAWAAWEFGNGLWSDSLTRVCEFITAYRDAGGPAEAPDDAALRNLVRQRLLGEMHYIDEQTPGTEPTEDDLAYRHRQDEVCERLRQV